MSKNVRKSILENFKEQHRDLFNEENSNHIVLYIEYDIDSSSFKSFRRDELGIKIVAMARDATEDIVVTRDAMEDIEVAGSAMREDLN